MLACARFACRMQIANELLHDLLLPVAANGDREFAVGYDIAVAIQQLASDNIVGSEDDELFEDVVRDELGQLFPVLRTGQELCLLRQGSKADMFEAGKVRGRRCIEGDTRPSIPDFRLSSSSFGAVAMSGFMETFKFSGERRSPPDRNPR
jgi:hypothetical protein